MIGARRLSVVIELGRVGSNTARQCWQAVGLHMNWFRSKIKMRAS